MAILVDRETYLSRSRQLKRIRRMLEGTVKALRRALRVGPAIPERLDDARARYLDIKYHWRDVRKRERHASTLLRWYRDVLLYLRGTIEVLPAMLYAVTDIRPLRELANTTLRVDVRPPLFRPPVSEDKEN